jgi:hypothetical protein
LACGTITQEIPIPPGALSQMQNFQILNGYKLRKRSGYSSIIAEPFETPIRGQWYGKLNNRLFHVVVTGGHAYVVDSKDKIEIGELDDAKTTMFQFGDVLYMQNGKIIINSQARKLSTQTK